MPQFAVLRRYAWVRRSGGWVGMAVIVAVTRMPENDFEQA